MGLTEDYTEEVTLQTVKAVDDSIRVELRSPCRDGVERRFSLLSSHGCGRTSDNRSR